MADVDGQDTKAPVALITGITGQDGSYLTEFLLAKGYIVHGIIRRSSSLNTQRIDTVYKDQHERGVRLVLHYGDVTDYASTVSIISRVRPNEVYNLAAQSHVKVSFELPEYTANVDALGTLRILEALRTCGLAGTTKFYQASTSELYGKVQEVPQKETTPFYPRSPYGVAKLFSFWTVLNYREAYNMFACNGILFNHESPRRGPTFVTRKITRAVAAIRLGVQECLYLGNLNALRDWGHARDYVEAMWLMLQQPAPVDFVVATGEQHSVREFCELAFQDAQMPLRWEGSGIDEVGVRVDTGKVVIRVDPRYFRPTEVETLLGDCTKARTELKWQPRTSFKELVQEMVREDIRLLRETLVQRDHALGGDSATLEGAHT